MFSQGNLPSCPNLTALWSVPRSQFAVFFAHLESVCKRTWFTLQYCRFNFTNSPLMERKDSHLSNTLIDLGLSRQRRHLRRGQLQHTALTCPSDFLLPDNDKLLLCKLLFLADLLEDLDTSVLGNQITVVSSHTFCKASLDMDMLTAVVVCNRYGSPVSSQKGGNSARRVKLSRLDPCFPPHWFVGKRREYAPSSFVHFATAID